jgi:hypothetical protein
VFEDEWNEKKDVVKYRILAKLGKSEKVAARKCTLRKERYGSVSAFLERTHIQNPIATSINYALYFGDEIVAVMTFSKSRYHKRGVEGVFELMRYCSKGSVIGGFSKLLKAFTREYNPIEIISYSDKRWSTGDVYSKNGFTHVHATPLNYFWCKSSKRHRREKFQKHLLKGMFPDTYSDDKTEYDICVENGYWRIWDCGQDCWSLKL